MYIIYIVCVLWVHLKCASVVCVYMCMVCVFYVQCPQVLCVYVVCVHMCGLVVCVVYIPVCGTYSNQCSLRKMAPVHCALPALDKEPQPWRYREDHLYAASLLTSYCSKSSCSAIGLPSITQNLGDPPCPPSWPPWPAVQASSLCC